MGIFEFYDRDTMTAVLLDNDDDAIQDTSLNVFVVCDDALVKPDKDVCNGMTSRPVIADGRGSLARLHSAPGWRR